LKLDAIGVMICSIKAESGRNMDFDKVLKDWEKLQKSESGKKKTVQGPGKKANAPQAGFGIEQKQGDSSARDAKNFLEHWIHIHGVADKDSLDSEDGNDDRKMRMLEAQRLRRLKPQAVLDLHGKTGSEAFPSIAAFLLDSFRAGLEKVLIIHGKGIHSMGNHIMSDLVRKALETDRLAGSFGPADKRSGGTGATWVVLRRKGYFSR
jgi:DNA-nicking Smr family endonuclease